MNNSIDIEAKIKKGTTTLGFKFNDGVILATDSQSTSAYVESRYEKKHLSYKSYKGLKS